MVTVILKGGFVESMTILPTTCIIKPTIARYSLWLQQRSYTHILSLIHTFRLSSLCRHQAVTTLLTHSTPYHIILPVRNIEATRQLYNNSYHHHTLEITNLDLES